MLVVVRGDQVRREREPLRVNQLVDKQLKGLPLLQEKRLERPKDQQRDVQRQRREPQAQVLGEGKAAHQVLGENKAAAQVLGEGKAAHQVLGEQSRQRLVGVLRLNSSPRKSV